MQYKIALIGEAWGEAEEKVRLPFIGPAGYELNSQLEDAGIARHECFITNVFNLRPQPANDVKNLCHSKSQDSLGWPPLSSGQYLRPEFRSELPRLYEELVSVKPNVTVALGGTALWALTGLSGISRSRGTLVSGSGIKKANLGHSGWPILQNPLKVLPTYHPARVLRQYELRAQVIFDLMKAKRNAEFPEIRRPRRELWIEPSLHDLNIFHHQFIVGAEYLAVDIETAKGQITCIGFAPSPKIALVVPFWDPRRGGNYWPTAADEGWAWDFVRKILATPIPKIFQNGLYDIHWLWRRYGMTIGGPDPQGNRSFSEDTMLLHHALQPESPKGLGFQGSLYTDEPAWKFMRKKIGTTKKEDM